MKILGKTDKGFILQATEDEVARLTGCSYMGCDDWKKDAQRDGITLERNGHPAVGAEIPVNAWWDRVSAIAEREKNLAKLGENLKSLGDLISNAWPAVTIQFAKVTK